MGINSLPAAGGGAVSDHTAVTTNRGADPMSSHERLHNDVLALRDIAFNMSVLRALALSLLTDDAGIPPGPDGDPARIAFADLLRPSPRAQLPQPCVQRAATPGIPLETLLRIANWPARAIPYPRPALLAELLGSDIEARMRLEITDIQALWQRHVSYTPADRQMSATPRVNESMLRFAKAWLARHPGKDPELFFRPFQQLAQRCISEIQQLPGSEDFFNLIGQALESGLVPYDRLQTWAESCDREKRPVPLGRPQEDGIAHSHWEIVLRALCSPLALGLLAHGNLQLDTLISWVGLDARTQNARPGQHPPYANRLAYFLGSPIIAAFAPKAGAIENPDVIPLLANAYMPIQHATLLLDAAGHMQWTVLEAHIKKTAAEYRKEAPGEPPSGDKLAQQRRAVRNYLDCFEPESHQLLPSVWPHYRPSATPAQSHILRYQDSAMLVYEHASLAERASHHRLNRWSITATRRDGNPGVLHERFMPAKSLFSEWRAQGIAVDRQILMADFMIQGFDSAWAHRTILDPRASSARLQAWFAVAGAVDLHPWLDASMKEAVARWLTASDIPLLRISWIPALILCRMHTDQIEDRLRSLPNSLVFDHPLENISSGHPVHSIHDDVRNGLVAPEDAWGMLEPNEAGQGLAALAPSAHREISPLRTALRDLSEELRRRLNQLETIMTALPAAGRAQRECASLMQSWRHAIATLDSLLRPSLEVSVRDCPDVLETTLLELSAALNFAQPSPEPPQAHEAPTHAASVAAAGWTPA